MTDPPDPQFSEETLQKLQTYADSLPYSVEPNSEMQDLLDFYLTRICQCVQAKDYDPGLLQWDSMLNYWRMLKYPIPKAKRIALAKVYFDLCVTPGMPLHVVNTCLETLTTLLKSRNKLSVDDMRLPWKPIWGILHKDLFLSRRQFEITQTSNQMGSLAEVARRFFHPACVDEMLDVMLPKFNGLDLNSVLSVQYYLNTFLPLSHPTWLPMMMRIWSSVNSYSFDERHFALLADLATLHLDPSISDPKRIDEIPDDARVDEEGNSEEGPRLRWDKDSSRPNGAKATPKFPRNDLGLNGIKRVEELKYSEGPGHTWRGVFKDVGIFTQEEWDLIMCKCLASFEIPLADGGSFMTGPTVDEQAGFEFSRLPKSNWRIYSLAKLIIYSMFPDGKHLLQSGTATPFEIPIARGGDYFTIPLPQKERSYLAGCKALDSLARLIVSLESFFHPSNSGVWTTDLTAFLKYLVFEFGKRWYDETKEDCKVPLNRRLTKEIRRELVRCLRTPAFLAMFSADSDTVSNVQSALKSMVIMEPDLIVPPVLERAIPSLEALVETQRTLAVIKALGAIAVGIVSRDLYYPGGKHSVEVLELLLPGIDLNDPLKTICTTAFIVEISQHIEFSDLTEVELAAVTEDTAQAPWSPLVATNGTLPRVEVELLPEPPAEGEERLPDSEEDALLRASTSGFVNWVAGFIRRVILLLENLPEETSPGTSGGSSTDTSVVTAVMEACSQICTHLSEPLFDLVLGMIYDFATSTVRSNAVRAVHQLVESVARANPKKTLSRFVPFAIRNIRNEIEHGASSIRSTGYSHVQASDATLHWNIAILRGALHHSGEVALDYKDDFVSILELLQAKTFSKRGFSYTGKLLYSLLETLTHTYTLDTRFVNPDEWASEGFSREHHKHWGRLYAAHEVKVQWHKPSDPEIGLALQVLSDLIEPTIAALEGQLDESVKRDSVWSNDFCRRLSHVRNAFAGIPTLRQEFVPEDERRAAAASSDVLNEIPEFIASVQPVKSGFALEDPADPRYKAVAALRLRFGKFLHKASEVLLHHGDENTVDAAVMLIRSCRTYLLDYGDAGWTYNQQEDDYQQEVGVSRRHANQKLWPRAIFVRRAQLYHAARLRWSALERRCTQLETAIIDDIFEWCLWSYATVRATAQSLIDSLTASYDGIRKRCLPRLYKCLVKGTPDDKMKGALFTLNLAAFSKFAMGEPMLIPDLTKHLFVCQWNEKPSIQERISVVADNCVSSFVEPCYLVYQIDYPPTSRSVAHLEGLIPSSQKDLPLVKRCKQNRLSRCALQETATKEFLDILLEIAEDERTHWRYSITAIRLLRSVIRRDTAIDPSHVAYILSQTHDNQPQMRYYAQRAVMKLSRYIKMRTFSTQPEDLALYRNKNPLSRNVQVATRTHEYTEEYLESFKAPLDRVVAREEPLLQDKVSSGWLVWKDDRRYLLPSATKSLFKHCDPASVEALAIVRETASSSEFWEDLSIFYAEENHSETTSMDNISCVKSIVQLAEEACLPAMIPVLEELLANHEQNKQRGGAEMVAGLLAGSKHWPTDAQDRLWEWFTPMIENILGSNVKTDTLTIWSSFLEYILSHKDPRRVKPIIDWLVEEGKTLEFNSESSFKAIKTTFFVRTMIEMLSWRFSAWVPEFIKVYWEEIGSEHEEVTSYIADALTSFCKIHWRPTPSVPVAEVFVRECSTRPLSDDIMRVEHGYNLDALLQLVKELPQLRETRFAGAKAPRSAYDRKFMTVIRWVYSGLQEVNAISMYQYILPIMPELFRAAELQDSDDLASLAQNLLVTSCGVTPPVSVMPKLLETIFSTIRGSPSWRIRSNTLPMLQILYFRQVPIISEDMVTKIQDVLTECLSDEVVEVREKAAVTLSGILRCSPRRTILILKDRFVKQASRITLPKRSDPKYGPNLRQLHAAILGITALIDAFPYSVPSWLPELIGDVLSRHTYDPIPISTTVRKCATKFKETHQDTWHEDALKFDEEQMSALATLLAGSSYYA